MRKSLILKDLRPGAGGRSLKSLMVSDLLSAESFVAKPPEVLGRLVLRVGNIAGQVARPHGGDHAVTIVRSLNGRDDGVVLRVEPIDMK